MIWVLLAAVAVAAVVVRLSRPRRSRGVAVAPSRPVSTLNLNLSTKHNRRTKAALDAASSTLR